MSINIESWDDVEDILYDGTASEIKNIHCPDCKSEISYAYFDKTKSMNIQCKKCGILIRIKCNQNIIPNCAFNKI